MLAILLGVVAAGMAYAVLSRVLAALIISPWQLPGVLALLLWTVMVTLSQYVFRGCKPRFPEWTLPFEVVRAVIHNLTSQYGDNISRPTNAPIFCRQSELLGDLVGYVAHARNKTTLTSFHFNGLEHLWVRSAAPSGGETHSRRRVVALYFHGGGYVVFSPRMYQGFASELQPRIHRALCEQLGLSDSSIQVDVLLANYRKAPEHPYPRGPLDALAMYKFLLEEEKLKPHQIIVMGDSAGGGLTMTTMLRLRDEDPSLLPLAGILSCPFVDRETKGDERKTPYCILTDKLTKGFGDAYCRLEGPPATWGDASPYHCDLHGLPPVYIQAGSLDYILSHSKRLFKKAQESGLTDWTLEIFPNMPHVFSMYPPDVLPVAAKGVDAMAQYAATQFAMALKVKDVNDRAGSRSA